MTTSNTELSQGIFAHRCQPIRARSSYSHRIMVLVGMAISSLVILCALQARVYAQFPNSPKPTNGEPTDSASKSVSRRVQTLAVGKPSCAIPLGEAAKHKVRVLDPDGSIPKQVSVSVVPAKRPATFDMATLEQDANKRITQLEPNGELTLDLSNLQQFFFIESESGCLLLSAARILETDQLNLLAWSKVTVTLLRNGRPAKDMKMTCGTMLTSDMLLHSPYFSVSAVTNDSGVAEFDRCPAGELAILVNPRSATFQGQTWNEYDLTQYVHAVPEERLDVRLGDGARDVIGRFVFDEQFDNGIQEFWTADLEYSPNPKGLGLNVETRIRIKIARDGSFVAKSARPGEARMVVLHPGFPTYRPIGPQRVVVGPVSIVGATGESDPQNLGDIRLEFTTAKPALVQLLRESATTNRKPVMSQDEFTSGESTEFIASMSREGKQFLGFFDQNGRLVRSLSRDVLAPGTKPAIDFKNQRSIYLISNSKEDPAQKMLLAFDLSGHELYSRKLEYGSNYTVSTDTDSGRIALLKSKRGTCILQLLQPDGIVIESADVATSSDLCYSPADKAFWLSGRKTVLRVNSSHLKDQEEYQLPPEVEWTDMFPLKSGGVMGIERSNYSSLLSANRAWRIGSNVKLVGVVDLGSYAISVISATSCVDLGPSFLLRGEKLEGFFIRRSGLQSRFLIDSEMKQLIRFDSLADVSTQVDGKKGVWVLDGERLKRVLVVEGELITTVSMSNDEGIGYIIAQAE